MNMVVSTAISLVAIVALFWFARWLQLGGDVRIRDKDHARQIANDAHCGFAASDAVLDLGGYSALVRDESGRHVLIWLLGNRFVTRILPHDVLARLDQKQLSIDPQEPGTQRVTLSLGDAAQFWAAGLRHIPQ